MGLLARLFGAKSLAKSLVESTLRVLTTVLPRLSVRLLAGLLMRLFAPKSLAKSLAESLGSDYMHDSQRDSLRDSFFTREICYIRTYFRLRALHFNETCQVWNINLWRSHLKDTTSYIKFKTTKALFGKVSNIFYKDQIRFLHFCTSYLICN